MGKLSCKQCQWLLVKEPSRFHCTCPAWKSSQPAISAIDGHSCKNFKTIIKDLDSTLKLTGRI